MERPQKPLQAKALNESYSFILYHPGFSLHFSTAVLRPLRVDACMAGRDNRQRVSWIERQRSSEIRMAFNRLPVIWICSRNSAA